MNPPGGYGAVVRLRPLQPGDLSSIPASFDALGWPGKGPQQYQRYLDEQASGDRVVWVAERDGLFAGYGCLVWRSGYEPFWQAGIPEIVDLNVLPAFRRRGIGTGLMDAAESTAASRCGVVGLGCGLYADYGPAMLLYLGRGYRPDGRGVAYHGCTVPVGASVRLDDDATLMLTKPLP